MVSSMAVHAMVRYVSSSSVLAMTGVAALVLRGSAAGAFLSPLFKTHLALYIIRVLWRLYRLKRFPKFFRDSMELLELHRREIENEIGASAGSLIIPKLQWLRYGIQIRQHCTLTEG